jgi:4a-hydroxytetrahydrobiopterin dehydratase
MRGIMAEAILARAGPHVPDRPCAGGSPRACDRPDPLLVLGPAPETRCMTELADKTCVPCQGGVPPLSAEQIAPLAAQIPGWEVIEAHHLHRRFEFPDFAEAMRFAVAVGEVAEAEWHHPDLLVAWGRVEVTVFTHKIGGLAEADFVLAAKIDRIRRDAP